MKRFMILSILGAAASVTLFLHGVSADQTPVTTGTSVAPSGPGDWHHHGGPGKFGRPPGGPLAMMEHSLNLTEDQKAKVKAIVEASKPQIEAIHATERTQMKAVFDNIKTQVTPLLTPAQQKILTDMQTLHQDEEGVRE